MALETTDNRKEYSGNGVTTGFSFPYYFLKEEDLVVILRDNTTLVETPQVLNTNFTVSGEGEEAGGTVTMLVAPASGKTLIIYRDPEIIQDKDFRENDSLPAEQVEEAYDRLTMICQRLAEQLLRSVRVSEGFVLSGFDLQLPADLNAVGSAGKVVIVNPTEDGWLMGPTADDIENAQQYAADAAASAASADVSEALAQDWANKTNGAVDGSEYSAKAYAIGGTGVTNTAGKGAAKEWANKTGGTVDGTEYSAKKYAEDALASANAAALSAASNLWRDVVYLTFADSPYSITSASRGKMFSVDTSGGNVVINLPAIAGLDLVTAPFAIGIKKQTSDGNSITINRASTDTIDGATSKTLAVAQGGTTLIPDKDPSPDMWNAADFGASAGNLTADLFSGTGAQTAFTLSLDPGTKNNTFVFVNGVYQNKDTYSLSGTTLTFSEAPPSGTSNIQVMIGTLLSIGTPSDGTVTTAKLATGAVTDTKANFTAPTQQKFTSGSGTYSTPSNVKWIRVRALGGGGGGGGSWQASTNAGNGGNGGNTTFGANITAGGGSQGAGATSGGVNSPGAGGTATLSGGLVGIAVNGSYGYAVSNINSAAYVTGGPGGVSAMGGGSGTPYYNGAAPAANSGSGGGGGQLGGSSGYAGSGGGSGAYIDTIIANPAATYAYAVGAAGTAGTAGGGTGTVAGNAGAAGVLIIEEHYH